MNGKTIVITVYGHDKCIDKIAFNIFDEMGYNQSNSTAYCSTINNLELKGDGWVYAKVVSENVQYTLDSFIPFKYNFSELILKLDNRSLQKVLRELNSQILANAFKSEDEAVHSKLFQNMSSRASKMLKEDMEYLVLTRSKDVLEAQEKVISVIRKLIDTGEIDNPYND